MSLIQQTTHLLVTAVLACLLATSASAQTRPNFLVIMSDDMGFTDLGCYGGEIATPTLDGLAADGLRFTQFYNTARCCPTRASLLTGLYPHQAGVGHMLAETGKPGYSNGLNKKCRTMAEVLRPAGYRTYACGKWHVSGHVGPQSDNRNWPLQRGFDKFYGTIKGGGSFYDPTSLCRGNQYITPENDPDYKPQTYYYTDAISDNAVKFLADHKNENTAQPFLMYVTYTAAHWPMHALPEDIAKYKGRYDQGYDPIRQARFAKAAKLGLIDSQQAMAPGLDWQGVKHKKWESACMEVYAAMIDRMDQGIAKIVAELKRTGQFDNTLVFFLQDNGGCAEGTGRQSNAEAIAKLVTKPLGPNDLQPAVTPPMQTRDGRPVRTGPDVMPGPADTYIAYGEGWANVSNTPFREFKHWVHEGGISTPLIAHWPKGIEARGKLRKQPGHLIDISATVYDLAEVKYPADATPLEGKSLRPAFADQPIEREAIYWEHEGNRAVRVEDLKLVAKHGKPWELYDLAKDRVEANDLAAKMPEKVKKLAAKYEAYAARALVEPWPVIPAAGKKGGKK